MKFEEALKAMREGKRVTRRLYIDEYENSCYYSIIDNNIFITDTESGVVGYSDMTSADILADDWEIYEEKPKPDIIIKAKGSLLPTAEIKAVTINGNEITGVKHIIPGYDNKTMGLYFDCEKIKVEWENPDSDLPPLTHLAREMSKLYNPDN